MYCANVRGSKIVATFAMVIILLHFQALAQSSAPHADSNPAAEAEIKSLVSKMTEMIIKADWDAYAQHLAPDYIGTSFTGHVESKDEALARLRDPQHKIIVMDMEPGQRIRLYADTAISSTEFTISLRESGRLNTHRVFLTDTWLKRDGQWLVVAEQAALIGK